MEELTAFYEKNGFHQTKDSDFICFDMSQYKGSTDAHFRDMKSPEDRELFGMMDDNEKEKLIGAENTERLALLCAWMVRRGLEKEIPEVLNNEDLKNKYLEKAGLKLPDWMRAERENKN